MSKKTIPVFWSLFPLFFVLGGVLFSSIQKNGIPREIWMIMGTLICCITAAYMGFSWKEMEEAFTKKIADTWLGVLILILIGGIVGSWVYSGSVPMLIYYGIKLIQPSFIPITAFFVTALVAIFSGTSWGAAATSGVAFIGVAQAVGVPLPLIAGAIISGAYVGDKNSPISDTTLLSAMGAGSSLLDHLIAMLKITIPAVIISSILYIVLGLKAAGQIDMQQLTEVTQITVALENMYNFHIILLLPAVIVFVGSYKGFSPVIVMFFGSFTAVIIGAFVQDFGFVNGLRSFVSGFDVSMTDVPVDQIPAAIIKLLNRGGMKSMMGNVLFLITALTFGSVLQLIGALQTLLEVLLKVVKGVVSLISVTWILTFLINSMNGTQFTFLTLGPVLQGAYKKYNLHPSMLSRTMEDGGTLTEPITPWTTTAIYMSTTLGVSTVDYFAYTFFNTISIVVMFSLVFLYPKIKIGITLLNESSALSVINLITQGCGSIENIKVLDSCSTRIRLTLADINSLNLENLSKLEQEGWKYQLVENQLQLITGSKTNSIKGLLEKEINK